MRTIISDFAAGAACSVSDRSILRLKRLAIPLSWPAARWNRTILNWCWLFVGLGILIRLVRFLLRFPLWGDEASLAANLLNRSFLELLDPLEFQQVAPPLFLWIELAAVRLFGFNEWALRAFPFVCSLLSVVLFRYFASRLLRGVPLLVSVATMSVAYYPLRHGSEVKPYASDLLVALVLLSLAVAWLCRPSRTRWLWILAAFVPFALALSFPATFVAGGVIFTLALRAWRSPHVWAALCACCASLLTSFGLLFFFSTDVQMDAANEEGIMQTYWSHAFPPLTSAGRFLHWGVAIHTGQMFAYPLGGASSGSGSVAFLGFVVAILFLVRRRRGVELALCLAPFAVNFVAAAVHAYPYGGCARTTQHLAPAICLAVGLGTTRLLSLCHGPTLQRPAIVSCMGLLVLFGAVLMIGDLIHPYRSEHDRRVREFARWFWIDKAIGSELVCACTDLELGIFQRTYLWRGIAQYLCNQRIYSPRHKRGGKRPNLDAVSEDHPLRCVVFSRPGLSRDEKVFSNWLGAMQAEFDWVGYERNDFYKPHDHGPDIERIEVFEFVPHPSTREARALSRNRQTYAF